VTRVTDEALTAEADLDRLVEILADIDPETLLEDAGALSRLQGGGKAVAAAQLIRQKYNQGLRGKRLAAA